MTSKDSAQAAALQRVRQARVQRQDAYRQYVASIVDARATGARIRDIGEAAGVTPARISQVVNHVTTEGRRRGID